MPTNNDNVVEILLAYGFSKEESEKAARLAAAWMDKTQRETLNAQERFEASGAAKSVERAKKFLSEKKLREIEAAKEAADKAIEEEKRVTEAAKKEYEARLKSQTETVKKVGLVAAGIAAASAGVLYKALGYAQQYIAATEDNTQLTERWGDATKEINDAQLKIGKTLAIAILPALEKAADLVVKVADWMEANPEAVSAGLKGIAAIATMASIVSGLTAVILVAQKTAVVLKAIQLAMAATAGYGTAAAAATRGLVTAGATTGIMATVMPLALAALPVIIAAVAGYFALKGLGAATGTTPKEGITAGQRVLAMSAKGWMQLFDVLDGGARKSEAELWKSAKALVGLGDAAETAASKLENAAAAEKASSVVAAYQSYKEAQLSIEKTYDEQILAANSAAKSQMLALEKTHASNVANILKNAASQIASIMASMEKSAADYAENIAQINADGKQALEDEEKTHQENLRKLAEDHAEKVQVLTNSRDAIGLAMENRAYKKSVADENSRHRDAEKRISESIAKQLEQARKAYEEQLLAQQESLKAAEVARAEALAAENEAYIEQAKQIAENNAEALRAAEKQYNDENRAQEQAFSEQLRALDSNLLSDKQIRDAMYKQTLTDAQVWADAYALALASATGTPAPIMDAGGYAVRGTYKLAENGAPEFVMAGGTTKMAERLIGGSLTQERLLAGLAGNKKEITLNDHRRFDSRLSVADRNQIRADTVKVLREMLGANG